LTKNLLGLENPVLVPVEKRVTKQLTNQYWSNRLLDRGRLFLSFEAEETEREVAALIHLAWDEAATAPSLLYGREHYGVERDGAR
jgi:hypothetical protein